MNRSAIYRRFKNFENILNATYGGLIWATADLAAAICSNL